MVAWKTRSKNQTTCIRLDIGSAWCKPVGWTTSQAAIPPEDCGALTRLFVSYSSTVTQGVQHAMRPRIVAVAVKTLC